MEQNNNKNQMPPNPNMGNNENWRKYYEPGPQNYQEQQPQGQQYNQNHNRNTGFIPFIRDNYSFFGVISILLAVFYTFCLYNNHYGITYPIFVGVCIIVSIICLNKLKIKTKNMSYVYLIFAFFISISSVLTTSRAFHFFNFFMVVLLFTIFMIQQFYDEKDWQIFDYIVGIFTSLGNFFVSLPFPFTHISKGNKKKNSVMWAVGFGFIIGLPAIILVIFLLSMADPVFGSIFKDFLSIFQPWNFFTIVFMMFWGYLFFYCFFCSFALRNINVPKSNIKTYDPVIAITFTSILSVIYLLFCGIQILYLFVGGIGRLPEAYTYAEYARRGFFELLFVSGLNIVILLICIIKFRNNPILKVILTVFSLCTFVLIASSGYRMVLYISSYHLTFLRIFVLWSLVVIGFLLIGLMLYLFNRKFPLFKFSLLIVTCFYTVLVLSRPDARIAEYNISHMETIRDEDLNYMINELSDDAIPALSKITDDQHSGLIYRYYNGYSINDLEDYFSWVKDRYTDEITPRKYNYSKAKALSAAEKYLAERNKEDK